MTASASFPALGSTATICVTDADVLPPARALVERELAAIDAACSRFRPDAELVRLNAGAGRTVPVSATLLEAVEVALRGAALTDGLVDPTVGRTIRLAGYDRDFDLVRARDGDAFRARFATVRGWRCVEVDAVAGTVKVPRNVELDLGATAKALAADRAAANVAAATGAGVLVALGGDVAVAGVPPQGGWPVLVADDHTTPLDAPGPRVAVARGGLATSGIARRRWRAGVVELHHIVDPRTGRPAATPWQTATVTAASCVDANIASTAAIVLGADAPAWLERRGLSARLVDRAGRVHSVCAWPAEAA